MSLTDDLDDMTRRANRLADAGDWDGVLDLRDDCRAAVQRGKQLWPVASYCEYRLALDGPNDLAAHMLEPGAGRFALGPLTEVVAVHHTWAGLAAHAPPGPVAALAAHERVLRGEDLAAADVPEAAVLEVPLSVQPWEPAYPLAEYSADEAEFQSPPLPPLVDVALPANPPRPVDDRETIDALTELGAVWATESNGRVEAVAVEGGTVAALRALGVGRARVASLTGRDALALMAWAAASGGAHG
nr:hypothetical protein [Actinomycetota bacterium]